MTDKPKTPHTEYGCVCPTCTKWRQGIYDSGLWPRPRVYNGEVTPIKRERQDDYYS